MKNNILLFQFRENNLIAESERKIITGIAGKKINIKACNFFKAGFKLSENDIKNAVGIIIGGSGEFSFSDAKEQSGLFKKTKKAILYIKIANKKNIPILGICLGHQMLAYIFGAKIIKDDVQSEVGAVDIYLTKQGEKDPIFFGIPLIFLAQQGHKDSVLNMPAKAVLLAKSKRCKIQSFKIGNNIYGVQFHPELSNKKDILLRAKIYPDYNIDKIDLRTSIFGEKIIRNFINLAVK